MTENANENENENISAKISIIGDGSVGKTSIITRYYHDEFKLDYRPTLGADFVIKTVESTNDAPDLDLYLWDLAGQTQYEQMTTYFLKNSYFSLIVADIAKRTTWDLESWISAHEKVAAKPENKVIVLNKIDLVSSTEIEEIKQQFIEKFELPVYTTSAKTGAHVNVLFDEICNQIWNEFESN